MKHFSPTAIAASGMMTRLASAQPIGDSAEKTAKTISFIFANPGAVRGDAHQLKPGAWVANWNGAVRNGLSNFSRNPIVIEGHSPDSRGVGKVTSITELANGQLQGTIQFADTADGNELYELYRSGVMSAVSIGWIVVDATRSADPSRGYGALDITRAELLEVSLVTVPADENALVVGRSGARRMADRSRIYAAAREAMSFRSFGEQMKALAACKANGVPDARLIRAPAGASEGDPSGGGFLVAEQLSEGIVESIYQESIIAPLVSRDMNAGPLAKVGVPAIDEKSRADGSRWGGVSSYWAAEADSVAASFPRFRKVEFSAKKIIAAVVASAELVEDVALLDGHLKRALAAELAFKLDLAILAGSGSGQPLGVLNSSALITVAKSSGQSSATIVEENISSMWSRMASPCRRRAIWLVNEDALAQIDAGAAPFRGVFAAPAAGERFPRLKGAPVFEIEQASPLGTLGDIVLLDPTQYLTIGGDFKTVLSVDVRFLSNEIVFRFTMRVDGAPMWASPITPFNSTNTRSPFITLAAR